MPRHFACTACGRCCNRGPEMELSEATMFAGTFVTSLLFKVHSLPISGRSAWAGTWWRNRESRIPLRPALEEAERHLRQFASRRIDRRRDRQLFLDISAIVDDEGQGRCPALVEGLCSIHDARPLTCRTVPLHYSRAPSTLQNYLDNFTATPGYQCDTSDTAPMVLDGNKVAAPQVSADRERAVALAKEDRRWKERLLALMDDRDAAAAAGLPIYDAVLANSDNGYATMLPMIVAWRVALGAGFLSDGEFRTLCRDQAGLISRRITRDGATQVLLEALALYQAALPDQLSPSQAA